MAMVFGPWFLVQTAFESSSLHPFPKGSSKSMDGDKRLLFLSKNILKVAL